MKKAINWLLLILFRRREVHRRRLAKVLELIANEALSGGRIREELKGAGLGMTRRAFYAMMAELEAHGQAVAYWDWRVTDQGAPKRRTINDSPLNPRVPIMDRA